MTELFWKHRRHVRDVAVRAIKEADGDKNRALDLGKRMLRKDPGSILGALLINLALSLLVKLIIHLITEYVMKGGVESIPAEYQQSEPGFSSWSEDDEFH